MSSTNFPGDVSKTKPVDDKVTAIVNKLRKAIEDKTGKQYSVFVPVSYRSQPVSGNNYYIKVKVGEADYIHVSIFEPPPSLGEPMLNAVQQGKKEDDAIEPFA